jgi:hypothetical protein
MFQLATICKQRPQMLSWIVNSVGRQLPDVNFALLASFLSTQVTTWSQVNHIEGVVIMETHDCSGK